jgi:hypothetical protein
VADICPVASSPPAARASNREKLMTDSKTIFYELDEDIFFDEILDLMLGRAKSWIASELAEPLGIDRMDLEMPVDFPIR